MLRMFFVLTMVFGSAVGALVGWLSFDGDADL